MSNDKAIINEMLKLLNEETLCKLEYGSTWEILSDNKCKRLLFLALKRLIHSIEKGDYDFEDFLCGYDWSVSITFLINEVLTIAKVYGRGVIVK